MGYGVTVFFYLVIGIGVAIALWVGEDSAGQSDRLFRMFTAPFFWPLYIPILLMSRHASTLAETASPQGHSADGMALFINQVESELETALRSLEGWAENVMAGERDRIAELRTAWNQQADRIRELDQLLAATLVETATPTIESDSESTSSTAVTRPDATEIADEASSSRATSAITTEQPFARMESNNEHQIRIAACERTRQENILKLKNVRAQMHDNLMATLAWVRELVTMIHLANYTGAPASRAVELIQQIAAAVEGLSDAIHHTTPA